MSCADDVMEMQGLCDELAGKLTLSQAWKDRIAALQSVFRDDKGRPLFTWNRTYEFLCGKARRVDSWEKDLARKELRKLEAAECDRKNREHFNWLHETIERHRASGEELRGPHVDALEHLLRVAGDPAGALAVSDTQEGSGR